MWQPIETAPKDGTVIDLWVVEQFVRNQDRNYGERVANAWWGRTSYGRGNDTDMTEQWVANQHGAYPDPVEAPLSGGERYCTHWMPHPNPPA